MGKEQKLLERTIIMKSKLLMGLLLVALITNGASAIFSYNWTVGAVADWDDADGMNWVDELGNPVSKPDGQYEVRVRNPASIVQLDTVEGNWTNTGNGTRLRIYQGATLNIVDGGELRGFGWIRIGEQSGTPEEIGILNQSGGTIFLRRLKEKGKICIGDGYGIVPGSTYTISGGTLTYDAADPYCEGQLMIGSRDGEGTFVVVGDDPIIQLRNLYVAGDPAVPGDYYDYGTATLEFLVGENGVSPINLAGTAYIDQGTNTLANLIVGLTAAPVIGQDILLVNANSSIQGMFDSLNGGSAAEGALVSLGFSDAIYNYALTYAGGDDGYDITLLCVPEPATVAFISVGLGLLPVIKRRR
jgi:hypothetical protein